LTYYLAKYLECGIFAHGFARAWCDDCGHDYFVAYSCQLHHDRPHMALGGFTPKQHLAKAA
jgi:hypothetical protein